MNNLATTSPPISIASQPEGARINIISSVIRPLAQFTRVVDRVEAIVAGYKRFTDGERDAIKKELHTKIEILRTAYATEFNGAQTRIMLVGLVDSYPQSARWPDSSGYENLVLELLGDPPSKPAKYENDCGFRYLVEGGATYKPFSPSIVAASIISSASKYKFVASPSELLEECCQHADRLIFAGKCAAAILGGKPLPYRPRPLTFMQTC